MKSTGAFAIILDKQNKILLNHRRDYDVWDMPGGGVEINESPWQAVVREVKEETGLNVKIIKLAGIYFKPKKDEMVFNFLCQKISGQIKPSDEASESKYFKLSEIPKNTAPNQVTRIKLFFKNKNKLRMEIQKSDSTRDMIKKMNLKKFTI